MKKNKTYYDKHGLMYHQFRFTLWGNIKVLFCRIFGHQINNNVDSRWCPRCGLAHEEIFVKQLTEKSKKLEQYRRMKNIVSGVEGEFIDFYEGYHGKGILVLTDDGREYFAPVKEWIKIERGSIKN